MLQKKYLGLQYNFIVIKYSFAILQHNINERFLTLNNIKAVHSVEITEVYSNTFFDKNSVKATDSLKKLLKS